MLSSIKNKLTFDVKLKFGFNSSKKRQEKVITRNLDER